MKKSFLPLWALLSLSACNGDDSSSDIGGDLTTPVAIELTSGVTGRLDVVASRGQGVLDDSFSGNLSISLVRIDQLPEGAYPSDYLGDETSELSAGITYFPNEATSRISFGSAQYYLINGHSTKFFGWYPQSGAWSADDAKVTFPTIDGSTDIRMAHSQEGSKKTGEKFSDTHSVLSFTHALTMVKVFIKAEKAEYIPVWGKVTDIEFVGKQQQCELVFPATPGGTTLTTRFIGSSDLRMIAKDSTTPHTDLTLTATDYVEVGYAMFAPQTKEAPQLQLKVNTQQGGVPTISVPYPIDETTQTTTGLEAGKYYRIKLLFKADEITPYGTIEEWTPGGTLPEIPIG